ncbi:MAG: DinB family protein [Bryobacteraceae bacterium]
MNAYIRFKLAIAEDEPTVKPYNEAVWAELPDAKAPVQASLRLLESLHERWVTFLSSFASEWWGRKFRHPEHDAPIGLDRSVMMYAWHGKHHLAHVTALIEREGWK